MYRLTESVTTTQAKFRNTRNSRKQGKDMGILDEGNWVLCKNTREDRRPPRGTIYLIISSKVVTLSAEALKAMGNTSHIEVWKGKADGRLLFVKAASNTVGFHQKNKQKDGTFKFRDKEFVAEIMEGLILYGNVQKYFGSDDKPLRGAYFCVEGEPFKERDSRDKRKWMVGVEFDLAKAYYCQVSLEAIDASKAALEKKWKKLKESK